MRRMCSSCERAWLVPPINKVHINKFNSDKFNHPSATLIKSLTRPIWKSWARKIKHSWHRGCHAMVIPRPLPLYQRLQYHTNSFPPQSYGLITLSSQCSSSTQCLFIHDVSHSSWVYSREGFRVFKYHHVQQLWSPGELCVLPVPLVSLKTVSQATILTNVQRRSNKFHKKAKRL